MKRFKLGDRVMVKACGVYESHTVDPPAYGKVVRLRYADYAAWIMLAERRADIAYPFPADDESGRGTHVMAFPEDCTRA